MGENLFDDAAIEVNDEGHGEDVAAHEDTADE